MAKSKICQVGRVIMQFGFANEDLGWTDTTSKGIKRNYWLLICTTSKNDNTAFELIIGPFSFIIGIAC